MLRRVLFITLVLATLGLIGRGLGPTSPDTPSIPEPACRPFEAHRSGPNWQRSFFARWHHPYGTNLPASFQADTWARVKNLPAADPHKTTSSWQSMGPHGIPVQNGIQYSGRVLDIDALNGPSTTVAAASGGLWRYLQSTPVPLSDEVPSLWIGSFAYDPTDDQNMLLGTGEASIHGGNGLWKSKDGGMTWQRRFLDPEPGAIIRVRYSADGTFAHAATDSGYYHSADGGESWQRIHGDCVSDIAIKIRPDGATELYATHWGRGLFLSMDNGLSWHQILIPQLRGVELDRGAVTVSGPDDDVIYVAFAEKFSNGIFSRMKGIYKSSNGGVSWYDISPDDNYMGGQGYYNNVIAACPTDPDVVYAGGVSLQATYDGGASWETIMDQNLHVDYHALQWHPDGQQIWVGHDGGFSISGQQGISGSWSFANNTLPITQFVEIDAGGGGFLPPVFVGGAQDNGLSHSQDGGDTWEILMTGDCGGVEYGTDVNDIWARRGVYSGSLSFHSLRVDPANNQVEDISAGLDNSGDYFSPVERDTRGRMYTQTMFSVYSRDAADTVWTKENEPGMITSIITDFTVSPHPDLQNIYVCLNTTTASRRVLAKQEGQWFERGWGLPAGGLVRTVVPHPANYNVAYALMDGLDTPGQKIYKTTNLGQDWENITGDLPNVPLADLVVHADTDEVLYLGTGGYGFFRSGNGGGQWARWNNGAPEALMVTELKTVDLRFGYGGYHLVAGTYGRGIYRRDIEDDEISSVGEEVAGNRLISQQKVAPNPFNAHTTISFELARPNSVKVVVYDIAGRKVRDLLNEQRGAGSHTLIWDGRAEDGSGVASGNYLVSIVAGVEYVTQPVVLVK